MRNDIACTSIDALPVEATFGPRLRNGVARLIAAFVVARERRELAALDDRMLKDIGLSRSVAHREVSKPFFDVPEHRIHTLS